jgi:hypothetical protein
LTSVRSTGTRAAEEAALASSFEQKVEQAQRKCAMELQDVLRARKKLQSKTVPRWLEPSPDLLEYYHSKLQNAGPGHDIALNLSNLQGVDLDSFPMSINPTASRTLYEKLLQGPPHGCEPLADRPGGSY